MPSKKHTSIVFTPDAQRIKDRYVGAFSLRGMVSVGLIWFDSLLPDDQIKLLSAAKANKPLKPLITDLVRDDGDFTNSVSLVPVAEGMTHVSFDVPVDMKYPLLAFVETLVQQKLKVPQSAEPHKHRTETASG